METALVTGGTGLIGRQVVAQLCAQGARVVVLVRPSSDLSVFDGLDVTTVVGDILDESSYGQAVASVHQVFHLASLLKMPWSPLFRSVHVDGTSAVARACAAAPRPPTLVVVSSLAAAGPSPVGIPRSESLEAEPVSRYGAAKRHAELAAMAHAGRVPLTVVRPPGVFGPWDQTLLKLFRSVARGVHFVPGNGHCEMALVEVQDLARAIVLAGNRGERVPLDGDESGSGFYFAACSEMPKYEDLGALVADAMGVKHPRIVTIPRPAARWIGAASEALARLRGRATVLNRDKMTEAHSGSWTCTSHKATRDLEWRPRAPLPDLLRETASWYRAAGWLPPT